jgi:putative MFS transporter
MLYLIAFIPLIYAILLYYVLPESPRWLAARGRNDEALKIVQDLEADAMRSTGKPLEEPRISSSAVRPTAAPRISDFFRQPLASKAWFAAFVFFGTEPTFYVLLTFAPVLMVAQGFKLASSLQFVALLQVCGGIGGVIQGLLGDSRGRRPAIMLYALLSACGLAGLALGHSVSLLLFAGVIVGLFGLGIYPVTKLYVAEQFPTPVRGMGAGFAESFGRLFGGVVFVYLVPFLSGIGGTTLIIWIVIALLALTTFVPVAIFGRETKGLDVDTQVPA